MRSRGRAPVGMGLAVQQGSPAWGVPLQQLLLAAPGPAAAKPRPAGRGGQRARGAAAVCGDFPRGVYRWATSAEGLWRHISDLGEAPTAAAASAGLAAMTARYRGAAIGALLEEHCPLPGRRPVFGPRAPQPAGVSIGGGGGGSVSWITQEPSGSNGGGGADDGLRDCACSAASPGQSLHRRGSSCLDRMTLQDLAGASTPPRAVERFVWGCLRRLVPAELLAPTPEQRCGVRRAVRRAITLTRFETMTVHQATQGIATGAFAWMPGGRRGPGSRQCNPELQAKRQRYLTLWMEWLLAGLVVPLIRGHFYVTETESKRLSLSYFRKPVWNRLRILALRQFTSTIYREISPSVAGPGLRCRRLGAAKLRLVPKAGGVRPIVNLGARSTIPASLAGGAAAPSLRSFPAVNWALQNVQQVLKAELAREPAALGASVFGYDGAYHRLAPFLRANRQHRTSAAQPIYVVNVDVKAAFDSVDPERILRLVEERVGNGMFEVTRHATVAPAPGGCRVKFGRRAEALADEDAALSTDTDWPARVLGRKAGAVAVRQGLPEHLRGSEAKRLLAEHLLGNLVRARDKWLIQRSGIPQGSVVSTLLCSLYLADLEERHLLPLVGTADGGGRAASGAFAMARLIDDIIIITRSRAMAEHVVRRLHAGFPDYGVVVNTRKTALNFDMTTGGERLPRNEVLEPGGRRFVPWCGLLFDSATLEIQVDYTRIQGCPLREMMTLPHLGSCPGARLRSKLCQFVRHKCNMLLLDPNINSSTTIRVNIYQSLMVVAMRFHVYMASLPMQKGSRDIRFAIGAINGVISYTAALVARVQCQSKLQHNFSLEFDCSHEVPTSVSRCHVRWLGLHAFQVILQRKQCHCTSGVLVWLGQQLTLYPNIAHQLLDVVDPSRHRLIWNTRF
uniref:Telomerase reverse transcriptase n=1 Tax=Tetraselmis sp. GSL018 TaxID=582737 RepID=A0A061SFG8_9CHLO